MNLKLLWTMYLASACLAARGACAEQSAAPMATVRGSVQASGGAAFPDLDLSRVVVYLASHPELDRLPADNRRPMMAQRNKRFVGDLLVVSRGTTVEFPNQDPFSHNVFSRSRAASFDLDRYPAGQSKSYTFNEPGIVQLFCNIHPEMKATIVVVPNRCFARADQTGRFDLGPVPPGSYDLVVWHERYDDHHQPLRVSPGAAQEVLVTLAANTPRPTVTPAVPTRRTPAGVERGLGIKRERLNLPVVNGPHPTPNP